MTEKATREDLEMLADTINKTKPASATVGWLRRMGLPVPKDLPAGTGFRRISVVTMDDGRPGFSLHMTDEEYGLLLGGLN